ncbi:MAG: hypothetical protein LBC74_04160, partial [Planctomycetaceae bacterium]|nr:hypothetical protein [Planctomycetaceae bacterium]
MKMYFEKNVSWFTIICCFILGVFCSGNPNAMSQNSGLLAPDTILADRAKMLGYVENHITNKFPPML